MQLTTADGDLQPNGGGQGPMAVAGGGLGAGQASKEIVLETQRQDQADWQDQTITGAKHFVLRIQTYQHHHFAGVGPPAPHFVQF